MSKRRTFSREFKLEAVLFTTTFGSLSHEYSSLPAV